MRRTIIKFLHWVTVGLLIYFFFNEPEGVRRMGAAALSVHAGMGIILGIVAMIWFVSYMSLGLAGRAGPKLPSWGKKLHQLSHRFLYYAVPGVVLSGALAGVAAPYVIYAFDIIPISFGIGTRNLHDFFEEVHEIAFNILMIAGVGHTLFHLWRHFILRDGALRIMAPKILHRFL